MKPKLLSGIGLLILSSFLFVGCSRKTATSDWEQAKPIWEQIVRLNREFKEKVYADKPILKELYQKAEANIELLNQLRGQLRAMALPAGQKSNFDQGLEANISYYKCCRLIIEKRARAGQSYEELRDCASDCLTNYRASVSEGWPTIDRETFQISAKLEGLIVAAKPPKPTLPEPAKVVIVRQPTTSAPLSSTFTTARGVGLYPEAQYRRLTESDLIGKTPAELDIMRNEIFASHGRRFARRKYIDYFNNQTWYEVNPYYSDSLLSSVEKYNAALIKTYQDRTGLTTY